VDIVALRDKFRSHGYYERPLLPMLRAWAAHLFIGFGGLAAFVATPGAWPRVAFMAISCFGFVGLATLGHTASHNGASDRRLANRILLYFTYPFLLQLSAIYWHYTHCITHHPNPNMVGIDNDCDLRPLFYINESHQAGASRRRRLYFRIQWLFFPFALLLNSVNIQRKGWRYLLSQLRDPERRTAGCWIDLACMTGHLVTWLVVPMFFFSPLAVIGVYALRTAIIGVALFTILAPGHFPAEAMCFSRDQREAGDFYLRQTAATANFRTGFIGRFLCSGLEYQIEHHLFPGVSHIYLPRMAPAVQEFCARHGLPYCQFGWGEAIWKSYAVMFKPKVVRSCVESVRGARGIEWQERS
jgi:fatty acid desaturase